MRTPGSCPTPQDAGKESSSSSGGGERRSLLGDGDLTGGEGTLTQWVHCEFVVSFEAIHPVITQQVCGEFF